MTDKEKLNMLLEAIDYSFWNPTEKDYNRELTYPVIDKVKFVKRMLQEEPVSKDLEEASYRFACKCNPLKTEYSTTSPNPEIIKTFKTGAKWKEEQMMKDAIDAKIGSFVDGTIYDVDFNIDSDLKQGDKVKVIIVKSK